MSGYRFVINVVLCILILIVVGDAHYIRTQNNQTQSKWTNNEEIEIFREYLRIPTVQPNVDYKPAIAFLKKQAASLNLPVSIYYPADEENPVLVMKWEGSQTELASILLNSHMDVVPVFEEYWTHPPFAAEIDENGDIFARGAQDMKCVGMQYLAAIRALKRQGIEQLKRTIYVVFVPDEETGGKRGMAEFVKTNEFKAMNVSFMLDEGSPLWNKDGALYAYYGQRSAWQVELVVHGKSGHGSRYFKDTAGEKMTRLLAKINAFRDQEQRKFARVNYPYYGNVTTINLTILKGGVQYNVIPSEMSATFDMRNSIETDLNAVEQQLKRWCEEAGGNIQINYLTHGVKETMTVLENSNPFWVAFKGAVDDMGVLVKPNILSGGSDARFLRRLQISALGFSPLLNTIPKLHDHNEYINADVYLKGIEIYTKIIPSIANA